MSGSTSMPEFTLRRADWQADQDALRAIRSRVFIEEQHVPEALEWDGEDAQAMHWLAQLPDATVVGTVRMLGDGHIGRLAVLTAHRRRGIGTALLQACIDAARGLQLPRAWLHAQTRAIDFYARQGFVVTSSVFDDAGIPHRSMQLLLGQLDLQR